MSRRPTLSPTWKVYDMAEWDRICGVSPDLRKPSGPPFRWNDHGVCTNPRVFGMGNARLNYRVGIFTAQRPDGTWTAGDDLTFSVTGHGTLPGLHDRVSFPTEDAAIVGSLKRLVIMIERDIRHHHDGSSVPCERPMRDALRRVEEEIARRTAPREPTYTQLELF